MRSIRLAVLAAAAALILTGCGGSGSAQGIASLEDAAGDATATTEATGTTVDREQAMLEFAQCMRDNGLDMEDPTVDEDGNFRMMRPSGGGEGGAFEPADREAMQAAREACSQYLEGIAQGFNRPDMTELQDLMLEYAACMRENGVDMPDPDFADTGESGGQGPGARLGFNSGDFDTSDPTFQAANEVCQEIFGANGMPGMMGGGPGGGPREGGAPPEGGTPPDTDN